jgi:hypothetical protein
MMELQPKEGKLYKVKNPFELTRDSAKRRADSSLSLVRFNKGDVALFLGYFVAGHDWGDNSRYGYSVGKWLVGDSVGIFIAGSGLALSWANYLEEANTQC